MRIGIVGLGLIGGSLALALRRLRHSIDVTGVARRTESSAAAVTSGAVDQASTDLSDVSDCDIVVIATPIDQIAGVMERLAPIIRAGTLITDVASVKRPVVGWAQRLSNPSRFLGGHPVAGKTQRGLDESDAAIFYQEPWIFTPTQGQDVRRFDTWFEMVRANGATPSFMRADAHERQLASLSQLACTLASAFAETVPRYDNSTRSGPEYRIM